MGCVAVLARMAGLTFRAEAEEFQFVGDAGESIAMGDALFQFLHETFLYFDDAGAIGADQMMMVLMFFVADQFVAGDGVAEIKPLHQVHFFQEMHRTVDGGEVAFGSAEELMDFANGQGMFLGFERGDDRYAGPGELAGFAAEFLRDGRFSWRWMGVPFHGSEGG